MSILILLLAVLVGHGFIWYFKEKYYWNNGTCRQTKKPWEYKETDLNGVRLYTSEDWSVAVTYSSIDKRP